MMRTCKNLFVLVIFLTVVLTVFGSLQASAGSISGTVSYSGSSTGTVYVGLFDSPNITPGVPSPLYVTTMSGPGAYTITNVPDGTYYVGAIRTNDLYHIQMTDPYGMYGIDFVSDFTADPVIVSSGAAVTDKNFIMIDGTQQYPNPFYVPPAQHTASGTYTYNSGTGVITWNWTSSDFTCEGPSIEQGTVTVTSLTATTLTWMESDGYVMTWTRPGGTAGDIVGTWTSTDSATGNSWTITFNADGTVSLVGIIVQCGSENPKAEAQHWSSDYFVSLRYADPGKTATSVSVTGPGITGSVALTYNTHGPSWGSGTPESIISFGTTYPTGLPYTYTFSITDATGTWTADSTVSCFQEQFVSNISPTGTVSGTPTFSWTGISDSNARYSVQVNDSNGNWLWANYFISGTSIVYNGPALTPGATYDYTVGIESSSACSNPTSGGGSYVAGSFTYQNGTTISLSSSVKDNTGLPVSGATIEQVGNSSVTTTSASDGSFTLNGLPSGTDFSIKMSAVGYVPIYSKNFNSTSNITPQPYTFHTSISQWGVNAGKGVIDSRVVDTANVSTGYIEGAVVSCTSALHPGACPYTIKYRDDQNNWGTTATYSNGKYFVLNVDDGDTVIVTATKTGWNFGQTTFVTHADAESQGRIHGTGLDNDGDGYTSDVDCDDNNPAVNPGADDSQCDGIDNDCDGTVDDGYVSTPTTCGIGACASTGELICQNGSIVDTCTPGAPGTEGPFGNATCSDTIDNDCDGLTDASDSNCQAVDLIETSVSNPPATAVIGSSFSVTDTVKNQGNIASGASATRYYLSVNKRKDATDKRLTGGRAVPALNPGATSRGRVNVTIPTTTPSGTYYLLACADDRKAVAESNEVNNCRASGTTVQVTP